MFKAIISVYEDGEKEIDILKELETYPLFDHKRRPIPDTSWFLEDVSNFGWDCTFGEDFFNGIPLGTWVITGTMSSSQDYYGDWDTEYIIEEVFQYGPP